MAFKRFLYADYAASSPSMRSLGVPTPWFNRREEDWNEARCSIAAALGFPYPGRVVFGFGATDLLNKAILGIAGVVRHYFVSPFEHNSCLRPIFMASRKNGTPLEIIPFSADGVDYQQLEVRLSAALPGLVAIAHTSNVTGRGCCSKVVCQLAHRFGHLVLLDASQTIGRLPFNYEDCPADIVVFPTHKGVGGYPGFGVMLISPRCEPEPVFSGGSGMQSELEEMPASLLLRLEPGTQNYLGIRFLAAAAEGGLVRPMRFTQEDLCDFATDLGVLEGVELIHGPGELPFVNFNVEGLAAEEVAEMLREGFGIYCRGGLHCAPLAHRFLGTFPSGTVRLSFGAENEVDDLTAILHAVELIARGC